MNNDNMMLEPDGVRGHFHYTPELTETEWQVIQMLSMLEDMSEDTWLKAKKMMEAMALKQNDNFRRFTEILFRVSAHERERSGIQQA